MLIYFTYLKTSKLTLMEKQKKDMSSLNKNAWIFDQQQSWPYTTWLQNKLELQKSKL